MRDGSLSIDPTPPAASVGAPAVAEAAPRKAAAGLMERLSLDAPEPIAAIAPEQAKAAVQDIHWLGDADIKAAAEVSSSAGLR